MTCLDENQILQYVEGVLSPAEEQALEAHVVGCDDCRWTLSQAGAAALESEASTGESPTGEVTRVADERLVSARAALSAPVMAEGREIGEVLQGSYVLRRFIGRGGSGAVYEAAHTRLPRRFAIKFLDRRWAADATAIARLRREAEVTASLSHPNIVDVVDFNHAEDQTPFVVMEYLEGETLAQLLQRQPRICDLAQVAAIVQQIIAALAAVHARGIVHRDLKPSNIFLCRGADEDPLVKVVDFGIAKVQITEDAEPSLAEEDRERPLTKVRQVMGTPAFMSPEQALGRSAEVTPSADIFSLGAMVFQMLTGERPFQGDTRRELLEAVASAELTINERWSSLASPLRQAITRALDTDPAARQPSVNALWRELSAALPVETLPASPGAIASGGRGRTRWWIGLAATATVLVAAAAIVTLSSDRQPDAASPAGVVVADAAPARQAPAAEPVVPDPRSAAARASRQRARVVSVAKPPRSTRRRRPARPGTLVVQSKAAGGRRRHLWAHVTVDGKARGETPLVVGGIAPGSHRVRVHRPGFVPVTRSVRVRPGRRVVIKVALRRAQ